MTVYYKTRDNSAVGGTDYTATGDQSLTFEYNAGIGAYPSQSVSIQTSNMANAGTFSVLVTYLYDENTATPCSVGTTASVVL